MDIRLPSGDIANARLLIKLDAPEAAYDSAVEYLLGKHIDIENIARVDIGTHYAIYYRRVF